MLTVLFLAWGVLANFIALGLFYHATSTLQLIHATLFLLIATVSLASAAILIDLKKSRRTD